MFRTSAVLTLTILALACAGCGNNPTATVEKATITIAPQPEGAPVGWTLGGLSASNGSGYKQLSVYAGHYVLTWVGHENWVNLDDPVEIFDIGAGERLRFEATFVEDAPASVEVNAEPDGQDQAWRVTSADGQVYTGTGDATFAIDHSGPVTIQWLAKTGWWLPFPNTETQVAAGNTVTFTGHYQIVIEDPDGLAVCLPSGSFVMGTPASELGHVPDEYQHEVTLSHRFWIDRLEVDTWRFLSRAVDATLLDAAYMEIFTTRRGLQTYIDTLYYDNNANISVIVTYMDGAPAGSPVNGITVHDRLDGGQAFLAHLSPAQVSANSNPGMGAAPLNYSGTEVFRSAAGVTWYGAAAFCDWLNLAAGLPRSYDHQTWEIAGGDPYAVEGYRLPTEAEWEYACRAGTATAFVSGDIIQSNIGDRNLDLVAWYGGVGEVRRGGLKRANAFGLYDMHGNAWEWCTDYFDAQAYFGGDAVDPSGPLTGTTRCRRGGNVTSYAVYCRSGNRGAYFPGNGTGNGFRPARIHGD